METKPSFSDEFSNSRLSAKAQAGFITRKLQPRSNAYNGIGLQRPSMYLQLDDDDFQQAFVQVAADSC